MKKKILLTSILMIIIGSCFAFYIYKKYDKDLELANLNLEKVYFVQIGAYKENDNLLKITKNLKSYIVLKEDDLYKIYVGINLLEENSNKIKNIYEAKGFKTFIKTKNISNQEFIKVLEKYSNLLKDTNQEEIILEINKIIFKEYKRIYKEK